MVDQTLFDIATPVQRRYLEAIEEHRSLRAAARALGMKGPSALGHAMARLRAAAARKGYDPKTNLTHILPPGQILKGASTLYDKEGNLVLQWVKSKEDSERIHEIVRTISEGFLENIKGKSKNARIKHAKQDNVLLSAYCIGDAHLGMYSWGDETGADFDLNIAEQQLMAAIDRMVAVAPNSKECLIAQLGDFLHMDDTTNATPMNSNRLDADTRFLKVLRAAVKILKYIIETALSKHEVVRVRNVAGNHDPHSSIALTLALAAYYDGNPRVIIEDSPSPFWYMTFGDNLIGLAHGHAPKPEKLAQVLAVEAAKDWHLPFKYVWHGHIHHKRVVEEMHVLIESFRTLAARDAWHTSEGYSAGREMQCIVLHKQYGEIERYTANLRSLNY